MSGTETLFTPPTLLPRSSCSLDPVRFFLVSPSVLFLSHFSFCWPSYVKLSSYHNKTSKYLCHWSPGQQLRPSDDSIFWSVASDPGFFIPPHRVLWTSSLRSHLWAPSSSLASLALKGPFPTGLICRCPPIAGPLRTLMFPFIGWEHPSCQDSESLFYSSQQLLLNTCFGFLCFSSDLWIDHTIHGEAWPRWDQRGVRQVVVYNVTIWPPTIISFTARTPYQCFAFWHPLSWGRSARLFGSSNWALVDHKGGKIACPASVKDAYRAYILLFEFVRSFQIKNLISWLLLFIGNGAGILSNCFSSVFCSPAFSNPFSIRCLRCGSSQNYPALLSVTVISTEESLWLAYLLTTVIEGRQGRTQDLEADITEDAAPWLALPGLLSILSYRTQGHPSRWHHLLYQSIRKCPTGIFEDFLFHFVFAFFVVCLFYWSLASLIFVFVGSFCMCVSWICLFLVFFVFLFWERKTEKESIKLDG